MGSKHIITFVIGMLVGWLVLPMVIGMFGKRMA